MMCIWVVFLNLIYKRYTKNISRIIYGLISIHPLYYPMEMCVIILIYMGDIFKAHLMGIMRNGNIFLKDFKCCDISYMVFFFLII